MPSELIAPLNAVPRIPLGSWVDTVVTWMQVHWAGFFNGVADGLNNLVAWIQDGLLSLPIFLIVAVLAVLALLARGVLTGVGSAVGLLLIDGFDQWANAMDTLAVVVVASVIALLLAIPVGILAARMRPVSVVTKPVMDFMQTLPSFVYLLPALFLLGLGSAAAVLATIVFAMPPGVRLTELGIRQVDKEMVEAGQAFGATPRAVLRGIQVPLAMPTIMAGVNQVIMLALSMTVIAGLVGSGGLGGAVVQGLQTLDVALGAEAGVAVVILAIYLDRVTAAVGQGSLRRTAAVLRGRFGRKAEDDPSTGETQPVRRAA
ncbi:MAG TPA: ABC transporter permease subunit [Marmoricola sp.]|nr:ABC transporter permease subunit [Marmoricola sp.]